MDSLSTAQARRIALAAQGFTDPRPRGTPDLRVVRRVIGQVALFQIDSVNVVTRAQYVPIFARSGPYDRTLLDRAAGLAPRRLFEYWGHEASLLPVELQPYLRFRMARAQREAWGGMQRIARDRPDLVRWVAAEVRDRGPVTARDIEHDVPRRKDHWGWNWSEVKRALEWLFFSGEVTAARRNGAFERVYDLPERVLPASVLAQPTPEPADAARELVRTAAQAHGISTQQCLRDYFRLTPDETKSAVAELVEAGELLPVQVEGWRRQAYLYADARVPRRVRARALLSPFDSLIFERTRSEKLFDFHYRVEIYVPSQQRLHGYYVFPFLLGDRLVARVDLKADRQAGVLRVQGAYAESYAPPETASELAGELATMAAWLGLSGVNVNGQGDLAPALARATGPSAGR